jgi:arsenate reductase
MRREHVERNILFLCEDNAYFSQIAEAVARHLAPPRTRIFSAGINPGVISLRLIQAMQELGISMRGQKTKSLDEVPMDEIDLVVSFAEAHKKCTNLPGRAKIEDWEVPNSPASSAEPEPALEAIRENRDEIDKRVFALFLDHWRNAS